MICRSGPRRISGGGSVGPLKAVFTFTSPAPVLRNPYSTTTSNPPEPSRGPPLRGNTRNVLRNWSDGGRSTVYVATDGSVPSSSFHGTFDRSTACPFTLTH